MLDWTLRDRIADGDNVVVYGVSQSAVLSSVEMSRCSNPATPRPRSAVVRPDRQ